MKPSNTEILQDLGGLIKKEQKAILSKKQTNKLPIYKIRIDWLRLDDDLNLGEAMKYLNIQFYKL